MLILIKPTLQKFFKRVLENDYGVWFETNLLSYSNKNTPGYICFCYVKPYVNKHTCTSESIFFNVENGISKIREKGVILICGDFNYRRGEGGVGGGSTIPLIMIQ